MRRDYSHLFPLISMLLLFPALSYGQAWSGILAPSRAIDWSHAGLPATFPDGETTPNPWTPPTRTQCGSTISGGTSGSPTSAATVNGVINGCAAGTYVLLGSGYFAGGFAFKNNVTVRGSGANSTFLTGGLQIGSAGNQGYAQLTASPAKGSTSVTVSSTQPPTNAQVWFAQCDTNTSAPNGSFAVYGNSVCSGTHADNGGLYVCGLDSQCDRNGGGTNDPHFQVQFVYIPSNGVTNNGNGTYTVNFSPGLYMPNWSTGNTVTLVWDNQSQLVRGVGVEDLSVSGGINFGAAYASWVKGVRVVTTSDSGIGGAVNVQRSNRILFANNYIYAQDSTASYGADRMAITHGDGWGDHGTSDILFLNNILQEGMIEGIGASAAVVFGYNYIRDAMAGNGSNTSSNYSEGEFQHHAGTSFLLREGNQQPDSFDDATWGTHNINTWFRNYYTCADVPFGIANSSKTIEVGQFARFENIIGNAFGVPTCTSTYSFPAGDPLTGASLMRWGNCDQTGTCSFSSSDVPSNLSSYPNAVPFQNSVPGNQNLPASFFMNGVTAHPGGGTGLSWWKACTNWTTFPTSCAAYQTQPFPPVGPDVTGGPNVSGHAYDIPAALAWKNLPIDTSYQISYTVTGSSWSGGTETLNVVLPGGEHLMGGFQLTGANSACYPTSGASYTGRADGELLMTGSTSGTSISYALPNNPGTSCTGTVKWPDVRQFDERVYASDSGATASASGTAPAPPTNLSVAVQ